MSLCTSLLHARATIDDERSPEQSGEDRYKMLACQAVGCTNEQSKIKQLSFFRIPNATKYPEKKGLAMKWLHNITKVTKAR